MTRGAPLSGLRAAIVVTLWLASGSSSAQWEPAYQAVVRRYASGDRQGAVADMARLEARLRDEITGLASLRRKARRGDDTTAANVWGNAPVTAALMLHTDCAIRARAAGLSPRLHESAAVEIARLMTDDPPRRAFAGRWYGCMAALAQADNRWDEALDWAERGLRDFPDSAELLLVRGSIAEMQAVQATPRTVGEALVDPNTRSSRSEVLHRNEVRQHLQEARNALRSAVAADPSLSEARLRLGRVAWRLGDLDEARSDLQDVLARAPGTSTAFLAHLFLGRIEEDASRLDEAQRAYEAALAIDGQSQSARVARSHALLRKGEPGAARAEIEVAVRNVARRKKQDPLWLYPWGPSVGVEDRLEALRREASS